jgi:hypothetical protein
MPNSFSLSAVDSLLFLWDFLPAFFIVAGWVTSRSVSLSEVSCLSSSEKTGISGGGFGIDFVVVSPLVTRFLFLFLF